MWGGLLTGLGTGAMGSLALGNAALAAAGGSAALTTSLGAAGAAVIFTGGVAIGAVIVAVVVGIIAEHSYVSSGTILGFEVGGANHRCGSCGEAGTYYYGWDVSYDGQNCGSPACGFRAKSHSHNPTCELGPREFSVVGGGGGTGASAGGNHWSGGDDDNDCGLWILFEGDACAACRDLLPEDDVCAEEGGCSFTCDVCSDAGSSEHGTVDACVGVPNELEVEPQE